MSEIVEWLLSPHGRNAVEVASRARSVSTDPLAVAKCLQRELDLPAAYRQAASLQADLRDRLIARWGSAPDWLLNRDGIEQATHPAIRNWRANQLVKLGVKRIADLGCGLGFEAGSFADAGLSGYAIERDLETASIAAMNLRDTKFDVLQFDFVEDEAALAQVISETDALFVDPARRDPKAARTIDGRSGNRVTSPENWSPSWSWVKELGERQPRLFAKIAPGIDKELLPANSSTVWSAVGGSLVEASVWWPGFQLQAERVARAVDRHGDSAEIDSLSPTSEVLSPVLAYVLDPSPAVTRAGLVTNLAASVNAARMDEHLGFLTCETEPEDSPLFNTFEVLESLPLNETELSTALQRQAARDVQIIARGWGGDVDALTRSLKKNLNGDKVITILIARIGDSHLAVLAQRLN